MEKDESINMYLYLVVCIHTRKNDNSCGQTSSKRWNWKLTNKNCFGKNATHRNGLNKICERHNEVKIPRHVTAIETNQIIILVFKYVDNYLFTFGLCFLLHKYMQWMNISVKVENKSFNEPKRIADKWVNKVFDLLKYLR